jgi:hypothetical protein
VRAGRYLAALAAMDAEVAAASGPDAAMLHDLHGLALSFVGDEPGTLAAFDRVQSRRHAALEASPVDTAEALDAIPAIVAAAKGRHIVILNESHHAPRHRAFALELARGLRGEGFDTLAAETFQDVAGTTERGYPTASTGFYTAEPVFGELVRGALELGYRLVAYEHVSHGFDPEMDPLARINEREIGQAQNLVERVFDADPDARLFVYVGYSHATETWDDPGGERELAWMAARLADATGHDPLTIDQTTGGMRSEPALEDPHWRRADAAGRLDGPKLFRVDGEPFVTGDYAGKVDLQVFHPRTTRVHGRPDWLAHGRRAVAVPDGLVAQLPADERALLQAFHAGEGADAIPADQFLVAAGERADLPRFLLSPGEYRLAMQTASGATRALEQPLLVE